MANEYTFYPQFEEMVALFRGVAHVWLGTGDSSSPGNPSYLLYNDAGVLYAEYVEGTVQILGPVSSYAEAVQRGVAGPGTAFDTPAKWAACIAQTTQNALASEAWATGKEGGTDVPSTHQAYQNNAKYYSDMAHNDSASATSSATQAASSATAASQSEHSAALYEDDALEHSQNAAQSASAAETSKNNAAASASAASAAQTAAEAAQTASETAQTAAETAQTSAESSSEDAEAWAVGQRNGTDVGSSDTTYHNNAKYYSSHLESMLTDFESSAISAVSTYQNSNSGTVCPVSGTWTANPDPVKGTYLWTKTVFTWTDNHTTTMYTVSYTGVDGTTVPSISNTEIDTLFA